ncbi:MAG TPA: hypothetical protein ENH35_02995 [Candidatus Moranbacteria bacterium]|nr:hypothetical protein [Candidatus Pacearchaeota archaeon]HDZ85485.1 hypothetical protein [Candidatus Moranbacteria bacterium]
MAFLNNPIKKYKCDTCGNIEDINLQEDERAIYDKTECKCGGLMEVYVDKAEVKGDIDEIENRNPVIPA